MTTERQKAFFQALANGLAPVEAATLAYNCKSRASARAIVSKLLRGAKSRAEAVQPDVCAVPTPTLEGQGAECILCHTICSGQWGYACSQECDDDFHNLTTGELLQKYQGQPRPHNKVAPIEPMPIDSAGEKQPVSVMVGSAGFEPATSCL